jgi:anti-sigma factor RsiW
VSEPANITDLELSAYIDGELDAARAAAVEEAAARNAGLSARIAGYRADKQMMKTMFAPLAERPIPAAWETLARTPPAGKSRRAWYLAGAIAAALLLLLGGARLYRDHEPSRNGDVVEAALQLRTDTTIAEKVVNVTGMAQARAYDAALQKVAGANVKVPDLEAMGYRVMGLRFYGHAAEILYHDEQGNLFTLYLRPSDGKTRFDQFKQDGLRVCVWQDDRISTVMAGNMSAAAMQRLASLTYVGLTA